MSREDITQRFGAVVAHLVDGVTKLDKINMVSRQERQAEGACAKLLMAMVKDVGSSSSNWRIGCTTCARSMRSMKKKRRRIAQETLDIYAPIAHRLGIYAIRSELEDLALKYLEPEKYSTLFPRLPRCVPDRQIFAKADGLFKTQLTEMGIECEIEGQEKHVYSIYKNGESRQRAE